MDIGLGLPIARPELLPDWARRAEHAGFSTLALLDRLVWHNPEPLVTLGVLAGATTCIRLQTEVLLGPLRQTALLAKQVATLDRLSDGRFSLGIGVGGRAATTRPRAPRSRAAAATSTPSSTCSGVPGRPTPRTPARSGRSRPDTSPS